MPTFSDLSIVVGQKKKKTYQGSFRRCRRTLWVSSAEDPSATVHGLRAGIRQVDIAYARGKLRVDAWRPRSRKYIEVLTMGETQLTNRGPAGTTSP